MINEKDNQILGYYYNGRWAKPNEEKIFENICPSTGKLVAKVWDCGAIDAKKAIDCAYEAQKEWSNIPPKERAVFLTSIADAMKDNLEMLAKTITIENGKPINEAKAEVLYAADFFTWYAEEGKRAYGEIVPSSSLGKMRLVTRKAIGVAGLISPWNFPQAMLTRKLAPALAAGCTAVIKPAEQTPSSAIELFKIIDSVGIPPGAANLICTLKPEPIGEEFCISDKIRVISFTGSAQVGKSIIKQSAKNVTKLLLEHGGNAAFAVFEDADIQTAVDGLIACKFRNAGQTCICANRVYVHRLIYQEFIAKLEDAVKKLKIGDGMEQGVSIGPIIDEPSFAKIESHVSEAIQDGAKCICGGKRCYPNSVTKAFFYKPTLIVDVKPEMKLFREETFGPVIPIFVFDDDFDLIKSVNDTKYGLAAYAYTKSLKKAFYFSENVEAGIIGINDAIPSAAECPFGGFKESGLGREGGWRGLDEFLETKYVSINLQ